jgi:nucleotide-binding universal stress UspA family protein
MQTIIVPLDQPDSERVLPLARRLAAEMPARIVVLHVPNIRPARGSGPSLPGDLPETRARLGEVVRQLRRDGFEAELEVVGAVLRHPGDVIAEVAKRHGNAPIVLATRGDGPLVGLVRKSVGRQLLRKAPGPVIALTPRSADTAFWTPSRGEPSNADESLAVAS